MIKTDDFILSRLIWKAEKFDLPTKSSFYVKDLSLDIQQDLATYINQSCGQPVLFFTKPTKEWTLICTREIICKNNQETFRIELANIESIKPPFFDKDSGKSLLTAFREGNQKKSEWDKVIAIDKQGKQYFLHADKGADLFTLWNILLMATRLFK